MGWDDGGDLLDEVEIPEEQANNNNDSALEPEGEMGHQNDEKLLDESEAAVEARPLLPITTHTNSPPLTADFTEEVKELIPRPTKNPLNEETMEMSQPTKEELGSTETSAAVSLPSTQDSPVILPPETTTPQVVSNSEDRVLVKDETKQDGDDEDWLNWQ